VSECCGVDWQVVGMSNKRTQKTIVSALVTVAMATTIACAGLTGAEILSAHATNAFDGKTGP
jgi:hypothetical protein